MLIFKVALMFQLILQIHSTLKYVHPTMANMILYNYYKKRGVFPVFFVLPCVDCGALCGCMFETFICCTRIFKSPSEQNYLSQVMIKLQCKVFLYTQKSCVLSTAEDMRCIVTREIMHYLTEHILCLYRICNGQGMCC